MSSSLISYETRQQLGRKCHASEAPLCSLTDAEIEALPIFACAVNATGDFSGVISALVPNGCTEFLVSYAGKIYLVDTQDYGYARYIGRLAPRDAARVLELKR